ncbi:MAG: hypothetical protein JWR68_665 [Polaromonas sp.]|nr:hypothetical protein [Polaromonas sp.]
MQAKNVMGTELAACSYDPLTGFSRDGCCSSDAFDHGSHLICVRVTAAFLKFSSARGNDLVTPLPEHRFAGLKPGDRWCLCALRWREALEAAIAPPVILEATHCNALQFVTLAQLEKHGFREAAP